MTNMYVINADHSSALKKSHGDSLLLQIMFGFSVCSSLHRCVWMCGLLC